MKREGKEVQRDKERSKGKSEEGMESVRKGKRGRRIAEKEDS
jgi:hypothetical protein